MIDKAKSKNKSKTMWVRVTPAIDRYLRQAADFHEIEIAEVIRRSILEYKLAHPLEEDE